MAASVLYVASSYFSIEKLQAILTVRAAVFLVVLVLNPRPRGQRSTCDMSNVMQHAFHNSSQLMRQIIAKPFVDIAAV